MIERALDIDPKYSAALYNKSLILGRLGRKAEAMSFLQDAIEEDSQTV